MTQNKGRVQKGLIGLIKEIFNIEYLTIISIFLCGLFAQVCLDNLKWYFSLPIIIILLCLSQGVFYLNKGNFQK